MVGMRLTHSSGDCQVRVEMVMTKHPFHISGPTGLPYPSLVSGNDAQHPQKIGMTYMDRVQKMLIQTLRWRPGNNVCLAAPRKGEAPAPSHPVAKHTHRWAIHRHALVKHLAFDNRAEPFSDLRDRIVHLPMKLGPDFRQLGIQLFTDGLSQDREHGIRTPRRCLYASHRACSSNHSSALRLI